MDVADAKRKEILSALLKGARGAKAQDVHPVGNRYGDLLVLVEAVKDKIGDDADRLLQEADGRMAASLETVQEAFAKNLKAFRAGEREAPPPELAEIVVPNRRSDLLMLAELAAG